MGDKVFQKKILDRCAKPDGLLKEYPKDFIVSDLRVAIKLCKDWEKKRNPF